MWEFMKSAPWTFAVAGVVLLGAIVGVIYGIVTSKARAAAADKGFMVRDGHELRWLVQDVPLAVWFHPDLPMPLRDAWEVAASIIERAVGGALFMRGVQAPDDLDLQKLPTGNVGVVGGDPKGTMQADSGSCEHRYDKRDGRILAALVTLPWVANGLQKHVCLHEQGHVLGLDHDDRTDSVMYPVLSERQTPGALSEVDVERLRTVYRRPTQEALRAVK